MNKTLHRFFIAAVILALGGINSAHADTSCPQQSYQPMAPDVIETPITILPASSGSSLSYPISCVGDYTGTPSVSAVCNAGVWTFTLNDNCQMDVCYGDVPANAISCNNFPNEDYMYNFVANRSSCDSQQCEYICQAGYKFSQLGNDLGSCVSGTCTGDLSAMHAVDCNQAPASGSAPYVAADASNGCDESTPCQAVCDDGYQYLVGTGTCIIPVASNITVQPASVTVTAPATATFTVAATGTPAPSYQWMQELPNAGAFTAITGATSASYTTPATTTANNGIQYECVVTNISGSVTSAVASLAVNATPQIAIASPVNNSTLTTSSLRVTAIASESYGTISSVAFYKGTTLLGTVTSTSPAFTYAWFNIPAGTYTLTAVATDSLGVTVTSSPITVTINAASFTYAVDDNVLAKTDALNHTTTYQYDNLNRLLKITFVDNSTVSFVYDAFGNQTSVTDQRGNTLAKTYDIYERLAQTKDPLNGITQFAYDTEGHLLTLTDANGHATTYTYDANGKVLTQTNALNFVTTYTYDPVGNLASRIDANSKTTNYTYDIDNRLINTVYPDNTSIVNVYDAIGRKTSMTDATGQTSYTYDALSRLLTKTSPGTNNLITYTYDTEGNRLTSVDQNNRTITNTYDALNRLSTVADPNGTTTYGYDGVSNNTSVGTPNGVTESYTYDSLNRVLTAVNAKGATVVSSFSNMYDVAGMITKKTNADGSWTAYSYDALNRLIEETKQTSSGIIYDYVYTYDLVGNRLTWVKNTTLGSFWSVDSLNMPAQVLTNVTNGGYGNTANPTQVVNLVRNYTYDNANRLSNWSYVANIYSATFLIQTDTYTYDNNGNRLTKQAVLTGQETTPQQTTYSYDFENRLQGLSLPNASVGSPDVGTFVYNGEGLRTQAVLNSVASNYLYDGFNVLVERDASNNTTKAYTRGLDFGGGIGSMISQNYTANNTAVTQYYDYNDLGAVADLTTSTGASAASYNYDAFGNLLVPQASGDTNRYLFSTKEFDSREGLEYFGARYYDPEIGRWLTPDPLGFVNGPDEYAYCGNNPINCVDPLGLYWGSIPFGLQAPIFKYPVISGPIIMPGFTGVGSSVRWPGFTGANGPTSIPGLPDEFGPISINGFPDNLGGKERNPDIFANSGGSNEDEDIPPQPPTNYRNDNGEHFDKNTQQDELEHWHYQEYNWSPTKKQWFPGPWKYGGPGKAPGTKN